MAEFNGGCAARVAGIDGKSGHGRRSVATGLHIIIAREGSASAIAAARELGLPAGA